VQHFSPFEDLTATSLVFIAHFYCTLWRYDLDLQAFDCNAGPQVTCNWQPCI